MTVAVTSSPMVPSLPSKLPGCGGGDAQPAAPRHLGGVVGMACARRGTTGIVEVVATDDPRLIDSPVAHIGALEVLVDVLSHGEEGAAGDEFYGRLCEAVCRLTSMDRAVIFRYDEGQRRVRAAGAYGMELAPFEDVHLTVDA